MNVRKPNVVLGKNQRLIIAVAIFIGIVAFFALLPVTFSFDWFLLREAVFRLFAGEEIYQIVEGYGVFAPPWVFLMLSPAAILPKQVGWGVITALSIFSIIFLCRRYHIDKKTTLLILFSPPMAFNILYGNIDALMLFLSLAPIELMPIVAISKPQVLFGLVFKFLHEKPAIWLRAAIASGLILITSLLIFGLWPLRVIELISKQFSAPLSLLSYIWPAQLILAVLLIGFGFWRKDHRFYLAASPFMFSYASVGNFLGVLLVACSMLKWWQSALMIMGWWGAMVLLRFV